MVIVKLSYSILNAWASYRYEDAVSMYLGRDMPKTKEIDLGRLKHARWALYALRHGRRHPNLGGGKLVNGLTEQKFEKVIPIGDDMVILLRGVPDQLSDHPDGKGGLLCDEYKCGSMTATDYIDEFQLDYMKLLVPDIREGRYICYNPYFKSKTIGVKFLTEKNAENALEHIITYGGEIIDYLRTQRMLINYKGGKYEPALERVKGAKLL